MLDFFFEQRPIAEAWMLNIQLLGTLAIIGVLCIPLGFLLERMQKPWRRVTVSALVAIGLAGFMTASVRAAEAVPCVVCTLESIFALIVCWMWWC